MFAYTMLSLWELLFFFSFFLTRSPPPQVFPTPGSLIVHLCVLKPGIFSTNLRQTLERFSTPDVK